jgi:hypothetical protein
VILVRRTSSQRWVTVTRNGAPRRPGTRTVPENGLSGSSPEARFRPTNVNVTPSVTTTTSTPASQSVAPSTSSSTTRATVAAGGSAACGSAAGAVRVPRARSAAETTAARPPRNTRTIFHRPRCLTRAIQGHIIESQLPGRRRLGGTCGRPFFVWREGMRSIICVDGFTSTTEHSRAARTEGWTSIGPSNCSARTPDRGRQAQDAPTRPAPTCAVRDGGPYAQGKRRQASGLDPGTSNWTPALSAARDHGAALTARHEKQQVDADAVIDATGAASPRPGHPRPA